MSSSDIYSCLFLCLLNYFTTTAIILSSNKYKGVTVSVYSRCAEKFPFFTLVFHSMLDSQNCVHLVFSPTQTSNHPISALRSTDSLKDQRYWRSLVPYSLSLSSSVSHTHCEGNVQSSYSWKWHCSICPNELIVTWEEVSGTLMNRHIWQSKHWSSSLKSKVPVKLHNKSSSLVSVGGWMHIFRRATGELR